MKRREAHMPLNFIEKFIVSTLVRLVWGILMVFYIRVYVVCGGGRCGSSRACWFMKINRPMISRRVFSSDFPSVFGSLYRCTNTPNGQCIIAFLSFCLLSLSCKSIPIRYYYYTSAIRVRRIIRINMKWKIAEMKLCVGHFPRINRVWFRWTSARERERGGDREWEFESDDAGSRLPHTFWEKWARASRLRWHQTILWPLKNVPLLPSHLISNQIITVSRKHFAMIRVRSHCVLSQILFKLRLSAIAWLEFPDFSVYAKWR